MQKEAEPQRPDFNQSIRTDTEGQNDVWNEILLSYPKVLRYFVIAVGNYEEAIQLTQDTYFDVFRSLSGCELSMEVGPWLFRIARNNLLPFQRRRNKVRFVSLDRENSLYILPSHLQENDSFAEQFAVREAVRAIVQEMTPTLREPLLLNTLGGFTASEIAELLA